MKIVLCRALVFVASVAAAQPTSPLPVTGFEYDSQGNLLKRTASPGAGGLNASTTYAYDALDRLNAIIDPALKTVRIDSDVADAVTKVTDPRLTTTYSVDGLSDVVQRVSPDTGTITRTFDEAGNVKTATDARGAVVTFGYDPLGRVTSAVSTAPGRPTLSASWVYDQTGAGFAYGVGRLTSTSNASASNTYAYDALGRVVSSTQVVAPAAGANATAVTTVVGSTYDAAGNLTKVTYPSGTVLTTTYVGGLPSSVQLAKDGATPPVTLVSAIQYNAVRSLMGFSWQLANGSLVPHPRSFDVSGRVTRYNIGTDTRDLTYDQADRIIQYTHADASKNQTFGYDSSGRLTSFSTAATNVTYGYDDNGNRTSVVTNGVTSTSVVSPTSNRLSSTTNPARSFTYDAVGNTTEATFSASYDASGRLSEVTAGGQTWRYSYSANGQRVRKVGPTSATTIIFVHDGSGRLLGEYDQSGRPIREYGYLGDELISTWTPNPVAGGAPIVSFVHLDHLGTPRALVDTSNRVRWLWLSEPFGNTVPNENPSGVGAVTLNLRMPGQYFDAETGLFHNGFRDYDPTLGRYIESDPIGLAGGINTYAYVGGDPVNRIDPLGLAQCDVDDMTALARELNPDMNIPTPELAPLPVMGDRAVAGQVGALPFSRPQVNSEIYGGRLTPQQRVDLYNTIVHEAWHYDKQSFLTRGLGGRFEREARREGNARANAAKARILAGGQGTCGCRVK